VIASPKEAFCIKKEMQNQSLENRRAKPARVSAHRYAFYQSWQIDMKKEEMFKSLVDNAFDFLFKAISELDEHPKYSVIHFYAAVELLVKSRLMYEHWSLVVTKRQEPDWDKFVSGDFQSVSLDEAASRLDKIVRSGLSGAELSAFREVAKHRNKMVHFFHEAHSIEESDRLKQNIIKQQLKAWHFLLQLLSVQWREVFNEWNDNISKIDISLRKLHEFLQVVFDNLYPEIEKLKAKGILFAPCPSCGFDSQQHEGNLKEIYVATCIVCSLSEKCLKIECPECQEIVTFRNEGIGSCESCGKSFEPDDLADALIDSAAAHIAAMDGDDSWDAGNCSECDSYNTVIRTESDEWICSSCLEVFESLSTCGWCNEPNTGDMEDSYVTGCNFCEGYAGWHKDD
jgi:ribosomal protein L37AE/L43A